MWPTAFSQFLFFMWYNSFCYKIVKSKFHGTCSRAHIVQSISYARKTPHRVCGVARKPSPLGDHLQRYQEWGWWSALGTKSFCMRAKGEKEEISDHAPQDFKESNLPSAWVRMPRGETSPSNFLSAKDMAKLTIKRPFCVSVPCHTHHGSIYHLNAIDHPVKMMK